MLTTKAFTYRGGILSRVFRKVSEMWMFEILFGVLTNLRNEAGANK